MDNPVPEDARSEEHVYDRKFISRWADRCLEIKKQKGITVADRWARSFFSEEIIKEINMELARRNGRK